MEVEDKQLNLRKESIALTGETENSNRSVFLRNIADAVRMICPSPYAHRIKTTSLKLVLKTHTDKTTRCTELLETFESQIA